MSKMTETLRNMRVGDRLVYPIERLNYVKAAASNTGLVENRRYCTRTNREERTVTVTRLA